MVKSFFQLILTIILTISIILTNFSITNANPNPNKKFIKSSLVSNGIKLYAIGEGKDGYYKKFSLNINGKEKIFNWVGVSNGTWEPHMETADLNNDGKKELIIFMTLGEGTGIYVNKAHIVDLNNINEIIIEDANEVIKKHVKTVLQSKKFNVNIDSKNEVYKYKLIYKGEKLFENLFLKNHINYYIKNNILIAEVGAEISVGRYIGTLYIEYTNTDGAYKGNKIYFKKL